MKPRLIVGCDPSSKHLAFVAGGGDLSWFIEKYRLRKDNAPMSPSVCGTAMEVTRQFIDELTAVAGAGYEHIAYIEAPLVGRGGVKTTMVQAFVNGVVQGCFVEYGFSTYLVAAQVWKKAVVGDGGADKPAIGRCVSELWPGAESLDGDEDLTDAAAIYLYGDKVEGRRQRILAG